jgi:hypothetical protein
MEQSVYTIAEYCAVEKISRARLYDEWKNGEGVEFFRRGTRVLITNEARLRHHERLARLTRERDASSTTVAAE